MIKAVEVVEAVGARPWYQPLHSELHNPLNPLFVDVLSVLFASACLLFTIFQVGGLLIDKRIRYSFGSSFKLESCGLFQWVKLGLLGFHCLLLVGLSLSNIAPVAILAALIVGFIPLHLIEPTRSVIPSASLLIWWIGHFALNLIILIQDSSSSIKIWNNIPIQATLVVNSFLIFYFEFAHYRPTSELVDYYHLNDWGFDDHDVISEITFGYIQPLIKQTYQENELEIESLPELPENISAKVACDLLTKNWETSNGSLIKALLKSFGLIMFKTCFFSFSETAVQFIQPFVLQKLIQFFASYLNESPHPPLIIGYFYISLMFILSISKFILFNQAYKYEYQVSFLVDSSLTSLIYNKSMRLSSELKSIKSTGSIINNITMDIGIIQSFLQNLQNYLEAPIAVVLILLCLHKIIGKAVWGALLAAVVSIPGAIIINSSFTSTVKKWLAAKDERVSLTNEILTTIKSIKLYSWEKPLLERLRHIRNEKELKSQKKIGILSAFAIFIWSCIPFFISVAAYWSFSIIYDVPLTPDIVFPALSFFDLLTQPIFVLPSGIVSTIQTKNSLARLTSLLLLEENLNQANQLEPPTENNEICINIENAKFIWKKNKSNDESSEILDEEASIESANHVALEIDKFVARKSNLTCIVGKVGSGKSTFIRSLLGQLEVLQNPETKFEIGGSVAYSSQNPWILNATVKENILFGFKYNKLFYDKTVEACQLIPDFSSLPDGDKTTVGEKGVSLSGGQKARISLARAVYSRSDIYILDDILSAVDANVGKRIIEQVLNKDGLLANKSVVLATNSINMLHEADEIILLQKGKIIEKGDFETVMQNENSLLFELIKEFGKQNNNDDNGSDIETKPQTTNENTLINSTNVSDIVDSIEDLAEHINPSGVQRRFSNDTIGKASIVSLDYVYEDHESINLNKKTGHSKEGLSKGSVKFSVIWDYLKASNYKLIFVYLIFVAGTSFTNLMVKVILTRWSEHNALVGNNEHSGRYLAQYGLYGVLGGLFVLAGSFIIWTYCIIKGAENFHERLASSILRSPMSFFETTPVGRILNRFTEDMSSIDMQIPWLLIAFATILLNAVTTFGVITYNLPFMFFIILILGFFYNFIRLYFIPASRELKRLQSISKSPVIASIQESLNGVETITAYNQVQRFSHRSMKNIDTYIGVSHLLQCCNRWLSVRLQFMSSLILFLTSLLSVLSLSSKNPIKPALVGFIINYALSVSSLLNSLIRQWADIETQTVTVERLLEYINLDHEAEMITSFRPPNHWPDKGAIKFVNYTTKYRENLDPVLKNINLEFKGHEKIGIVGRTGAGKSTLTLALFRIIESTEGYIEIDGINTTKMGLYDLRRHLSIIPQDSQTIVGTVRQNIDPFDQYTDDKLWEVLELAHLKTHVENMKTEPTEKEKEEAEKKKIALNLGVKLEARISENGGNLSAGQKQLLCLARALLNPSKVLILDEATASVDVQTDKIVQETIRSQFKDRTIISIAHRLETILHSDRIVVLEKGEVAEFDTPETLLKDKNSIFYGLCKQSNLVD
ncbi:hypothetical protein HYPBUDRAFT_142150 [Hyphopichia burtonii NRRL Y-1933]|uniref:P-loop containing nucleoside triphosphate hydrolase protein n=1 Tax=Hyphopichia burtonii NRRL Y-1933 TaxID=984485 RepID=A0A1E4RFM9_9ASCO|nr:hypothetical protein HYPBUDRAFT_142150 [Hyphopichia burtonii NRRL Y-1933]ODV66026.1 hypothetical protein HYPBUDRAFT_142150 [Hyphopichia burtonii NRRL Y-1933]